jgi:hypothetical protein
VRPFVGAVGPVRNGVVPGSRSGVEMAIGASAVTASGPIGRCNAGKDSTSVFNESKGMSE